MKSADLIFFNGKIVTMNPERPLAQAIAIKFNRIVEVGTNANVKAWAHHNTTKIIDLKGKTVTPGFIDTHMHMMGFGKSLKFISGCLLVSLWL